MWPKWGNSFNWRTTRSNKGQPVAFFFFFFFFQCGMWVLDLSHSCVHSGSSFFASSECAHLVEFSLSPLSSFWTHSFVVLMINIRRRRRRRRRRGNCFMGPHRLTIERRRLRRGPATPAGGYSRGYFTWNVRVRLRWHFPPETDSLSPAFSSLSLSVRSWNNKEKRRRRGESFLFFLFFNRRRKFHHRPPPLTSLSMVFE